MHPTQKNKQRPYEIQQRAMQESRRKALNTSTLLYTAPAKAKTAETAKQFYHSRHLHQPTPKHAKGFVRHVLKSYKNPFEQALRIFQDKILTSSNSFSQSYPV
jgi:hypothetical protein